MPEAFCEQACANCTCDLSPTGTVVDVEDYKKELVKAQQHVADLEGTIKELQTKVRVSEKADSRSPKQLRSQDWFNNVQQPLQTAGYLERYQNYGITQKEFTSGKPIIGIAQTGSDIAPCNRHHLELAKRVREGIRSAGGIAMEFPTHPIQETGRRPNAALDRNLAYLSLVEVLHGNPIDAVVLLTGCDKTTPACIMAAATLDIPAICMNVGPMLNGYDRNSLVGAGTIVWKAEKLFASGAIDFEQLVEMITKGSPSVGHCNTMGTASTMNALAEVLGMALPGSAAIPAPYRDRAKCAYETGLQIVEMCWANRRPSQILTRKAFENAIRVNSAIGGSTNAPIHLRAIAKHAGLDLNLDDWDRIGYPIPLLLNMQPTGQFLGEEYYRAGGAVAIMAELLEAGQLHGDALSCNGKTVAENVKGQFTTMREVIRPFDDPLMPDAGFVHLTGTLFDSAIMKISGIGADFRTKYLSNPQDLNAFEGKAVVFDGPEDYKKRIDDPSTPIDENTILVMRGCGPVGFPGAAEVVNMRPPGRLIKAGTTSLPCIGDGRQSGTSSSPSILNASPEAAVGGNLAILRNGDKLRVDLNARRVDILLPREELQARRGEFERDGGYKMPASETPWQDLYRRETGQLDQGMVMNKALAYQKVLSIAPTPRHNH